MIRQFHGSIVLKGTKGIIQKSAKISSKTLQKLGKKKKKKEKMYSQQNELYVYIEQFFSVENLFEELRSNFRVSVFFRVLNTILPGNIFFFYNRTIKKRKY